MVRAKEIKVGETFSTQNEPYLRRIDGQYMYLQSYKDWSDHKSPSPSRKHILAIRNDFTVVAIHPDNTVIRL